MLISSARFRSQDHADWLAGHLVVAARSFDQGREDQLGDVF